MNIDGPQFSTREAHKSLKSIQWLIDLANRTKPKSEYDEMKKMQALRLLNRLEDETLSFIEEIENK